MKLEDFLNATLLDTLLCDINNMKKAVHDSAPIWLSETSSAYGGGAPNLSNTFAAGFVWLDKLGLAAREGIDVVVRQALYNGHYALLDDAMNPYPVKITSSVVMRTVGRGASYSDWCKIGEQPCINHDILEMFSPQTFSFNINQVIPRKVIEDISNLPTTIA